MVASQSLVPWFMLKVRRGVTGASEEECILSVVPVQVKTTKGNKTVETYAFLDAGSTDCFCTEKLMNQLKVSGRRTSILPWVTKNLLKPMKCLA